MMEPTDKKLDDPEWEMSNDVIREDDTEWKKRRAVPLLEMNNLTDNGENKSSYFTMYDEGHTRIMASLVPDEIIYNIGDYSKREFDSCLLFGDVSGFTDLCEKYNKSGKGGPSRLTQVLNNYIGAMVQEIMSHGGDVLNFSGDAFIALWKVTDQQSMRDAVHEAIDCSLVIQKSYGTYQTDVDVVVRVKLAVACGHLVFSLLGNEESSTYLITGDPINAIKSAESQSSAGEIVITARVSRHVSANEYLMKVLPDGLHAKVLGVGPNWRNVQRQYDDKESYITNSKIDDDASILSDFSLSNLTVTEEEEQMQTMKTDQYALRPAVNHAARLRLKDELRRFIIPPVVRGIDASEPLEYLTEIRQVAILFINCKVSVLVGPAQGIDVSDDVYVSVYDIVKDRYGCVNKINNIDKDLMVLVIFGLRGFKNELESQIALKCATECFEKIKNIKEIDEVAVAVTTGRCYCGAFGHTLRREYTVIGLVVNKAARLMIAYPNKVTCDKETFLFSKLEARNFILQEHKKLKGIVHPGPIYEFREVERSHETGFSLSPFPLLGREQPMDLYKSLLKKASEKFRKQKDKEPFFNMLVVRGDYRQGKTRLLEEILYTSEPGIPIHTFALTANDREASYRTIQLIFFKFIGMPGNSTRSSRERKIVTRLQGKDVDNFYFVFNKVFDVSFPSTMIPASDEEWLELLFKMFTLLCISCFSMFWFVAIDDADYIDDESWMLLQTLLDLRLTFLLCTMSTQKELTSYAIQVLKNEHIKIIDLKPINKWFHVGLVCQMLNIDGIPPELEKTVQNRSNGNPGWIESFLVTLLQSGGITMKEMTRIKAYNAGIVLPPLYMLARLSKEETDLWMDIMEERTFSKKDEDIEKRWKIFVNSCRESYPNLALTKSFEELKKKRLVKVCCLSPEFNLEDVVPEQHMEVVILKIFDSLTSYEQLLLKCSSVLGDIFPRDMLMYIMSSTAGRPTALAVKKLFEIQVLSCARGNFLEGGLNFADRLMDPNEDLTVKCDCIGLIIEDTSVDLPKYASCGYMRFRSSEFRETTYDLLTDNQKREFHSKAIRYMEKETRRCRACGSGYFTKYLGTGKLDEGLKARSKMKKYSSTSMETLEAQMEKGSLVGRSSTTSNTRSHISYAGSLKLKETIYNRYPSATSSSGVSVNMSESVFLEASGIGYKIVKKLKDHYNLTRTFSSYDYSQCTCFLILNTMYSQLMEHCKGAGLVEKIMVATIEYSYICMENKNAPQALKILEEGLQLLEGPMKDQLELDWMVSLKKGKLYTLLGKARICLEHDAEAYYYFMAALECYENNYCAGLCATNTIELHPYHQRPAFHSVSCSRHRPVSSLLGLIGVSFPKTKLVRNILKGHLKLKQYFKMYVTLKFFGSSFDEDVAEYCNNVAECLHALFKYFVARDMWREAELAAIWSLNRALQTETDFEILCQTYGSAIHIASITKQRSLSIALEVFALRTCHRKKTIVEQEELKAVSYLYYQICRSRFIRGDLDKGMQMVFFLWRVLTASKNTASLLIGMPMIAMITLVKKQLTEFGNAMAELAYLMNGDVDRSGQLWHYALGLMAQLETGFVTISTEKCESFMHKQAFDNSLRDITGKNMLIICRWLWELRTEHWEGAGIWQGLAWKFKIKEVGELGYNLFAAFYLIEGLIIYMVNKMDCKNFRESSKAEKHLLSLIKQMQKISETWLLMKPRLYHMKAYYTIAKYNDYKSAMKYLRKGHKLADQQHNDLELAWLEHSELAWSNKLSQEEKYAWQERCEDNNVIQFTDVDCLDKLAPYSLPLPLYL